jgi:hypothetical protein
MVNIPNKYKIDYKYSVNWYSDGGWFAERIGMMNELNEFSTRWVIEMGMAVITLLKMRENDPENNPDADQLGCNTDREPVKTMHELLIGAKRNHDL